MLTVIATVTLRWEDEPPSEGGYPVCASDTGYHGSLDTVCESSSLGHFSGILGPDILHVIPWALYTTCGSSALALFCTVGYCDCWIAPCEYSSLGLKCGILDLRCKIL